MFDGRARRLDQRSFANIVNDALLLVSDLSLSADLLAISERVALANETLHPHEVLAIKLLRLPTSRLPRAKPVEPSAERFPEHERELNL